MTHIVNQLFLVYESIWFDFCFTLFGTLTIFVWCHFSTSFCHILGIWYWNPNMVVPLSLTERRDCLFLSIHFPPTSALKCSQNYLGSYAVQNFLLFASRSFYKWVYTPLFYCSLSGVWFPCFVHITHQELRCLHFQCDGSTIPSHMHAIFMVLFISLPRMLVLIWISRRALLRLTWCSTVLNYLWNWSCLTCCHPPL